MYITINKFGKVLTSRQLGKEAYAAFQPYLSDIKKKEKIVVDFDWVLVFTPSWGDEFIGRLYDKYGEKVSFLNTKNPSVNETLKFLARIGDKNFNIVS